MVWKCGGVNPRLNQSRTDEKISYIYFLVHKVKGDYPPPLTPQKVSNTGRRKCLAQSRDHSGLGSGIQTNLHKTYFLQVVHQVEIEQ